ncbi:hypothetical protein [Absidia glauca]|uniref:BZIP domain-containing protein n=1 Tax=Absidia glauca TaxID=4829 RepID=A0A163MCP7_ABSGL|nr:hypothetical protein [Absidia glauca]
MMKSKLQFNSCAFDSDSLDDWLENDLRQSGILPSDETKVSKHIKIEQTSEWERHSCSSASDDKTVVGDIELDRTCPPITPTQSPTQLPPILKVLALLATLQQQGAMIPPLLPLVQQLPSSSSSPPPDSINPLQTTMTPLISKDAGTNANPTRKRSRSPKSGATEMDPLTLKRLKNTDAARRSRLRKMMKMEGLESRVTELEKYNEQLRLKVALAETERDTAQDKEARQRERVAALEVKLADMHRSLLQQDSKDQDTEED